MTFRAWWALDEQEINDPADVADVIEDAWSRFYPHGGRGIAMRFGPADGVDKSAPLHVDIDILEGRARLRWEPDNATGIESGISAHARPLVIADDPYAEPIEVPGEQARVTPGAVLVAVEEYVTTGQRPTDVDWKQG